MIFKNSLVKHFSWTGVDQKGLKITGNLISENKSSIKIMLQRKNIIPIYIKEKWEIQLFSKKYKITHIDITDFSVELSTLISAAIPLDTALYIMENSAEKIVMRNLISDIRKKIQNGNFLSEILMEKKDYFDSLFCNLVYVGEHSGTLNLILKHIAAHREKIATLRRKIKKALFYPAVVLVITFFVTCAMLIGVIPQFEQLFHNMQAKLPPLTQGMILISHLLQEKGILLLLCSFFLFFSIRMGVHHLKSWHIFFDRFKLKLPFFGKVLCEAMWARCFRTLSITLEAGLPLLEALQLTANIAGNDLYKKGFLESGEQVKNGKTLYSALCSTKLFTEKSIQMIRIGEESSRLNYMLQKLSDHFEEKMDYKIQNLSQLLEPVLMVFLCVLIGTLVIAMYLPIFKLGSIF